MQRARRFPPHPAVTGLGRAVFVTIGAWTLSHRDFWQSSVDRLERALLQESKRR